jgi:hypothetical protein
MRLPERETLRYFATELVGLELQPGQGRLVDLLDSSFDRLQTVVVRKGRRSGVTVCAALVAGWCGTVLAPRFREHLLPGEEFAISIVATSREQAGVAFGFVRRFLAASPILAEQVVAETTDSLRLATGCVIEAVPCSARSSRGRANGAVILDEAAHFVDSNGNASLAAVVDALKPGLAQFGPLGLMLVVSTAQPPARHALTALRARRAADPRFGRGEIARSADGRVALLSAPVRMPLPSPRYASSARRSCRRRSRARPQRCSRRHDLREQIIRRRLRRLRQRRAGHVPADGFRRLRRAPDRRDDHPLGRAPERDEAAREVELVPAELARLVPRVNIEREETQQGPAPAFE